MSESGFTEKRCFGLYLADSIVLDPHQSRKITFIGVYQFRNIMSKNNRLMNLIKNDCIIIQENKDDKCDTDNEIELMLQVESDNGISVRIDVTNTSDKHYKLDTNTPFLFMAVSGGTRYFKEQKFQIINTESDFYDQSEHQDMETVVVKRTRFNYDILNYAKYKIRQWIGYANLDRVEYCMLYGIVGFFSLTILTIANNKK